MSTDVAEATAQTITEPADDAIVVYDDAGEERAEQDRAALVGDVEKILSKSQEAPKTQQPPETKQQTGEDEQKPPAEEDADKTPDGLSQAMEARATQASIPKELAERLHQSGLLEESLAAFDRGLIQQSGQPTKQEQPPETPTEQRQVETPPQQPKDRDVPSGKDVPPPLDAEKYEDELVQRDAFFQRRIGELEAQVAQLTGGFVQGRESQLYDWFDDSVAKLGNEELFGKGNINSLPEDSPQSQNRVRLFQAYQGLCRAHGVDPLDCDPQLVARAYPAEFREHVFNKTRQEAQRETVDRLRDAQGRFLSSSRPSSGSPPAKSQQMTEEERHDALVADVDAYIKKTSG